MRNAQHELINLSLEKIYMIIGSMLREDVGWGRKERFLILANSYVIKLEGLT